MHYKKATFTILLFQGLSQPRKPKEVNGYTFEEQVKGETLSFGVYKGTTGWRVSDLRTGLSVSLYEERTRTLAVNNFERLTLKRFEEMYGTERYLEMCASFASITCHEQKPATNDDLMEKVDALIAKHERIGIAGETPCAIYLSGIGKNSPEMMTAKEMGAKFGNHKKFGKCWYFAKSQ